MSGGVPREVQRLRLRNLIDHHTRRGNLHVVEALKRQHKALPIGGIQPDEPRNLVAHCGQWHPVTHVPLRLQCCGLVLGEEDPP